MTRPGPRRRWDPFRSFDLLATVWSSAVVAPVSGATAAYRTLFVTLRRLVVGRRLAVKLDAGQLTLTVTQFDSQLDARSLAVGQLGEVRLAASEISWDDHRFERATAVLHNVHLRPSTPPALVAAPIDLTLEISTGVLDTLFRWAATRLAGDVGADGIARLRLAGRPQIVHLEVDARMDGSTLWVKPRRLGLRRSRLTLPARTPAYPVRLPELPHGLQLTDISFAPGLICLSGRLPQWRLAMPPTRLEYILDQLSVAGRTLNLTTHTRPR